MTANKANQSEATPASVKALISEERLNQIERLFKLDKPVATHQLYEAISDLLDDRRLLTDPVDGEIEETIEALESNAAIDRMTEIDTVGLIRRLQSTINQQRAEIETARREVVASLHGYEVHSFGQGLAVMLQHQSDNAITIEEATEQADEIMCELQKLGFALIENEKERT